MAKVDGTHIKISIHALREEGDPSWTSLLCWETNFYPRPPRGGRPDLKRWLNGTKPISIHALREEGDTQRQEERLTALEFLSTPSARRATRWQK